MRLIMKSEKIRWLKNVVGISKQFLKLKSDLRFMIYGIHVFTHSESLHCGFLASSGSYSVSQSMSLDLSV